MYEKYYNTIEKKYSRYYSNFRSKFERSFLGKLWFKVDGDMSFFFIKGKGELLEIGCNEGRNLEYYERNGYSVSGVEINKRAAEIAIKKGHKVKITHINNLHLANKYDIIVLSNVLEHTLEPIEFLKDVYRLLKPGGEVWISLPNYDSIFRHIFGIYWINWHPPFHITHFNIHTINKALKKVGLKIT